MEKIAKQNDMYNHFNYNMSDNTGLVVKKPIYSEPRIQPDGEHGQEFQPSLENPSPKNPMTIVKDALAENQIQHTPSPPLNLNEDFDQDEKQGIKCSFERPCAWKYDANVTGYNFEVKTGLELKEQNLTGIMPGPSADKFNDAKGHFLHVVLTPETNARILKSPVFSSTRQKCYLEVFLHQSSMSRGTIRIVIEPLSARSDPWVPSEILGNDLRKWRYHTFDIDR